ncbi:MAG: pilus assembly protein TadG-related protein [Anaerolineae bacterium]|jgi:hypothetical protein
MESTQGAQRGQALVIVVAAMVVLLVAVGLAVDGGTVLLERRRMQNAADAAALAGTRVLAQAMCGNAGADDGAIHQAAVDYAADNGVQDTTNNLVADYVDVNETTLDRVGDGSIPTGAMGISTTVRIERSTFFLTLVGIDTAGASAHALALTDVPVMARVPIRPIAVPEELMEDWDKGDEFTLGFKNCNAGNTTACYVKDSSGNVINQHRGWMNLNYMWNIFEADTFPRAVEDSASTSGCSSSKPGLKCWMQQGEMADLYQGDYVHCYPGTNSSAVDEAPLFYDSGVTVLLPVYDSVPAYEDIPGPKPDDATQGGGYYYHIVGLAAFHVQGANSGSGDVQVSLSRYIVGSGKLNPTVGAGYNESKSCRTGVQLVTLWR